MTNLWQTVYTEQELMDTYGLTAQQVANLRERGLPYIAVNATKRLYEANATVGYLAGLLRTRTPRPRKPKASGDAT